VRISDHFTLEELSVTEHRDLIDDNLAWAQKHIDNLDRLVVIALEPVRALLGVPMHVNSGVRCPELNKIVGGSPTSAHPEGRACDFTAAGYGPPLEICRVIYSSGIRFDQLIWEGRWVHIGIARAAEAPRFQVLTAHFRKGQPTTYTPGLPP